MSRGIEASGYVSTLMKLAADHSYVEHTSHPRDFATQIAWVSYLFIAVHDGLERPQGFFQKSR
jgi:hypothetical protein